MKINEIKQVLMQNIKFDEIHVSGDGNHFQIIAVSKKFEGMSRVERQQKIYMPLIEYISDNRIHALSIKAYTPDEWDSDHKLNNFKH